jgi:hypothetical protein
VKPICRLTVNLRDIPSQAFERKYGPKGPYYQVSYHISITFGVVMDFKLSHEGKIVGEITADYEE